MTTNRNALSHQIRQGLRKPRLVVPYLRRRFRNRRIRRRTDDHVAFYREVMADDVVRRGETGAVGTPSRERWLAIGEKQFDYLSTHGLESHHRLLEIGCGNLRAGWRFVQYLEPGHYVGVDASPDIVLAAQRTIVELDLQERRPQVTVSDGTSLAFLPEDHFDVVHAHSVFTHTPLEIVEAYLRQAHRVLKPGGFFDFTYNETDAEPWDFLREDFYYPTDLLLAVGERLGYSGRPLDDWDYKQAKIRLTKPC